MQRVWERMACDHQAAVPIACVHTSEVGMTRKQLIRSLQNDPDFVLCPMCEGDRQGEAGPCITCKGKGKVRRRRLEYDQRSPESQLLLRDAALHLALDTDDRQMLIKLFEKLGDADLRIINDRIRRTIVRERVDAVDLHEERKKTAAEMDSLAAALVDPGVAKA